MSLKKTKPKQTKAVPKKQSNVINDDDYVPPEEGSEFQQMVAELENQLMAEDDPTPIIAKKTPAKRKAPSLNIKEFEELEAEESTKRPRTEPATRKEAKMAKIWSAAEGALLKALAEGGTPLGRNYSGILLPLSVISYFSLLLEFLLIFSSLCCDK